MGVSKLNLPSVPTTELPADHNSGPAQLGNMQGRGAEPILRGGTAHSTDATASESNGEVGSPSASENARRRWGLLRDSFKNGELLGITQLNLQSDIGKTIKLSENQLKPYQCHVEGGAFKTADGSVLNSTENFDAHNKAGMGAFVLGVDKKFYLFNHLNKTDQIAHSSFAGKFARGAGEVKIKDAKIDVLHAHSGHYRPNPLNIYHVLNHFSEQGAVGPNAKVGFVEDPFPDIGKPKPARQPTLSFDHHLVPEDQAKLQKAEETMANERAKLGNLQAHYPPEGLAAYRDSKIQAAESSLEELKGTDDLKNSEPGIYAKMLKKAEGDVETAHNLTYEGYLGDMEKEVQGNIREARDNAENLQEMTEIPERISVVYDANEFRQFVHDNFDALKAKMDPAFFTQ